MNCWNLIHDQNEYILVKRSLSGFDVTNRTLSRVVFRTVSGYSGKIETGGRREIPLVEAVDTIQGLGPNDLLWVRPMSNLIQRVGSDWAAELDELSVPGNLHVTLFHVDAGVSIINPTNLNMRIEVIEDGIVQTANMSARSSRLIRTAKACSIGRRPIIGGLRWMVAVDDPSIRILSGRIGRPTRVSAPMPAMDYASIPDEARSLSEIVEEELGKRLRNDASSSGGIVDWVEAWGASGEVEEALWSMDAGSTRADRSESEAMVGCSGINLDTLEIRGLMDQLSVLCEGESWLLRYSIVDENGIRVMGMDQAL